MRYATWLVCLVLAARSLSVPATASRQAAGSIAGIVVTDEDTPHPVRRAVVTVTGSGLSSSRSTLTDDMGRFSIDDIPIGSYALVASRATFVTSAYGARRPGRLGRQVSVSAGQRISDLVIRLWRGGVLAGATRDEGGKPMAGITVRAIPRLPDAARYLSLTNNPTVTNERGEFRIFGLEPGDYFLSFQPHFSHAHASTVLQDEYVDKVLEALRRTGRGVPVSSESPAAGRARTVVFSPVYWPGTVNASGALPISVGAGTERSGLDVALMSVPTAPVYGQALLPSGEPAPGVTVRLRSAGTPDQLGFEVTSYSATTRSDGSFSIDGVPAGAYQLLASLGGPAAGSSGSRRTLWAIGHLETTGDGVRGVRLQLGPGLTIAGRIQVSDAKGAAALPQGASVALLPASVTTVSPTASLAATIGGSAVMPDGSFTVSNLRPDTEYRLFVNGLRPDLWPESAILGTIDLFDGPARLTANRTSEPMIVTFSAQRTELFGTLSGDDLISPIFVVVFPSDRSLWGLERRTRAVQPDATGRYRFENLPAGDYLVGAVGDVDPEAWRSQSFLEQLEKVAVKVVLGRDERRQLDIRTR